MKGNFLPKNLSTDTLITVYVTVQPEDAGRNLRDHCFAVVPVTLQYKLHEIYCVPFIVTCCSLQLIIIRQEAPEAFVWWEWCSLEVWNISREKQSNMKSRRMSLQFLGCCSLSSTYLLWLWFFHYQDKQSSVIADICQPHQLFWWWALALWSWTFSPAMCLWRWSSDK